MRVSENQLLHLFTCQSRSRARDPLDLLRQHLRQHTRVHVEQLVGDGVMEQRFRGVEYVIDRPRRWLVVRSLSISSRICRGRTSSSSMVRYAGSTCRLSRVSSSPAVANLSGSRLRPAGRVLATVGVRPADRRRRRSHRRSRRHAPRGAASSAGPSPRPPGCTASARRTTSRGIVLVPGPQLIPLRVQASHCIFPPTIQQPDSSIKEHLTGRCSIRARHRERMPRCA